MTAQPGPTEWITTKAAAELTGYDPAHIRWLIRHGRITGKKFGRDWMVNAQELTEYKRLVDRLGPAKHAPGGVERAKEK